MSRKKPGVSGGIAVPKDATRAGKFLWDPGAALLMICYPLSRARMREIPDELDARNA